MKFAEPGDVTSRFEGSFPSDRLGWVDIRVTDVENALMGVVPELRKTVEDIQARADARGDGGYLDRVKTLVCDKVLQLYRNPSGAYQRSVTVDDVVDSWSVARPSATAAIAFSADELASVQFSDCTSRSVRLIAYPEHPHGLPTC